MEKIYILNRAKGSNYFIRQAGSYPDIRMLPVYDVFSLVVKEASTYTIRKIIRSGFVDACGSLELISAFYDSKRNVYGLYVAPSMKSLHEERSACE